MLEMCGGSWDLVCEVWGGPVEWELGVDVSWKG